MMKQFIDSYYDFFDKKLNSSTVVVLIISVFVLLVWSLAWDKQAFSNYKTSVLESTKTEETENIVTIDWKKYKLIFESIE